MRVTTPDSQVAVKPLVHVRIASVVSLWGVFPPCLVTIGSQTVNLLFPLAVSYRILGEGISILFSFNAGDFA